MKQVEFMNNCISLSLNLAVKSMNESDYEKAMHCIQDARRSLNKLKVLMIPIDLGTDYANDDAREYY